MAKTDLTLRVFSLKFVDFTFAVSFHSSRSDFRVKIDVFLDLRLATNEIAAL